MTEVLNIYYSRYRKKIQDGDGGEGGGKELE